MAEELKVKASLEGTEQVKKGFKDLNDQLLEFKKNTALLGSVDPFKAMREGGEKVFNDAKMKAQRDATIKGFQDQSTSVEKFVMSLKGVGGPVGSMLATAQAGFAALASPIGIVTASIGAFVGIVIKASAAVEGVYNEMRTLAAVTGQSIEDTNVLSDAFKLMGYDADAMSRSMFKLSMEIEGGGKRLGAYGISVRDTEGRLRATGDVFEDTIKRLAEIGDSAQRNAALMQLFGRAGRELAPMLAGGVQELEKYKQAARDVGILTQEDVQRTMELKRAKASMNDAWEDMWIVLSRSLVPVMKVAVQAMEGIALAITAIIGLGTEWVKWMLTSKSALDPLSLSLKAVAASITLIGKGIEFVRSFGKGIADFLVPPTGAAGPGDGGKKAPAVGEIMTPEDVNEHAKLREAQLKADQKYYSELAMFTTASKVEQLRITMEYNDKLIALERKKTADLLKLTDDPVEQDKLKKELALKEVQFASERQLDLLKIRQAETEDAKQEFDKQLKAAKNVNDLKVRAAQQGADELLRLIERNDSDERAKIEDKKTVQIGLARDIGAAKQAELNFEIEGLKTIAAANMENAALQRETTMKIMDLKHQQTVAELDEIKQVRAARDEAAKAEEARQLKAAGMLGQLTKMAEEYAKSQGRKTITAADVAAAQQQQSMQAQSQLASFFGGGAVDPSKLQKAMEFQTFQRQMQQAGVTTGDVMSAGFGQAAKTFGSGFGFEAAQQAYGRGDIAGGKQFQGMAEQQGQAEISALKVPLTKEAVGTIIKDIETRGLTVVNEMLMKIPEVTQQWMEKMSDGLIRKLEMEASRT